MTNASRLPLSIIIIALTALNYPIYAQAPLQVPTSVDSRLLMDVAGPEQRNFLDAVYLIICPADNAAGTGFLLQTGALVTNSHVVGNCREDTLYAITNKNEHLKFRKVISDKGRDLALLIPESHLAHGLALSAAPLPKPGTPVSTWGYPLLYNGTTPLLSVGYVSGFRTDESNGTPVKHIVVNGAFNHGNSGGPLFVARSSEVIGVVVLTFHFYPPEVRQIIDALHGAQSGLIMGTIRRPDGQNQTISEAQVIAMVLDEFYQKTQVMIGEAIAGSEVSSFIAEHRAELGNAFPAGSERQLSPH
jgi:hypothetical protein